MRIDGQCHCGNIRFEAEVDPEQVRICHCTDCQNSTGSAYRVNIPAAKGSFRMSGGPVKQYVKTTAESGRKRVQGFCPECGTPFSPKRTCANCGAQTEGTPKFCPECGTSYGP